MKFKNYYLKNLHQIAILLLTIIVMGLTMGHTQAQNYVASSSEMSILSSISFGTSTVWATDRSANSGYFAWMDGNTEYSNQDDTHHVNGYVKKYGTDAFTFPVGSGTDLRTLTISAPSSITDAYGVAWIAGDPTSTIDPTSTPALHPIATVSEFVLSVSPLGQWDWVASSGTGAGLTVTVSMPDVTGFASANDLRLVGWNGTAWMSLGTAGASGVTENSTLSGTMIAGIQAIGIGKVMQITCTIGSIVPKLK